MSRAGFPQRAQHNDGCPYLARVRPMPLSANLGTRVDGQSLLTPRSGKPQREGPFLVPDITLWLLHGEGGFPQHGVC